MQDTLQLHDQEMPSDNSTESLPMPVPAMRVCLYTQHTCTCSTHTMYHSKCLPTLITLGIAGRGAFTGAWYCHVTAVSCQWIPLVHTNSTHTMYTHISQLLGCRLSLGMLELHIGALLYRIAGNFRVVQNFAFFVDRSATAKKRTAKFWIGRNARVLIHHTMARHARSMQKLKPWKFLLKRWQAILRKFAPPKFPAIRYYSIPRSIICSKEIAFDVGWQSVGKIQHPIFLVS